jgi:hypothetical protein
MDERYNDTRGDVKSTSTSSHNVEHDDGLEKCKIREEKRSEA